VPRAAGHGTLCATTAGEGGTVAATGYAATLAEGATRTGPVTVLVVTAVALLLLAAVFWSFLRRARHGGVEPLAVDRLDAPHLPEPPAPTVLATDAAGPVEDPETAAAISDEIEEGGPVLPEERS
jgi:hypothetical protein